MILRVIIVIMLLILTFLVFKCYRQLKKICTLFIKKNIVNNCKHKYNSLKNDERYFLVREAIEDLLKENRIKVSDSELDMLVESALYK